MRVRLPPMLRASLTADPKMQNTGSDGGLIGLLGKNTRLGDRADMAEQVGSWWGQLGESRAREAGNGGGNEQAGRMVVNDHRGQVGWHWNTHWVTEQSVKYTGIIPETEGRGKHQET